MGFNTAKNYYEILEVSTASTNDEIKFAYRKLVRKYHPDVNKTREAADIFKQITQAYEILSDEKNRHQYDIVNGIFAGNKQFQKETENPSSKKVKENYEKTVNKSYSASKYTKTKKQDKKSFSLTKLLKFWQLRFKKNNRVKELYKPQRGEDITTEITITPDEVIFGSTRVVNIRTTKTCNKCSAHRFANGDKCPQCYGSGIITETKKITVTIPKGIKHGTKLRLKGEGASGKNGGANGDVIIIVKIESKSSLHYDKLNICYNVPITPFEAALGEEISIPAFDGTIKFKLPPNTSSGQKFRIAKQGIKKHGKIGDLIITVSIEFSHNLSDDEIRLYRQLKQISNDNVRENLEYGN